MNYIRSFKRWLLFCEEKDCRLDTVEARIMQAFVAELSGTLGASGIKTCLSGIKWVFKIFN